MGELIVGKNRHGAIGTVNLTFRKELGQFANFSPLNMERLANDGQPWG
jgi:replicative DNA helicase